MDAAIQHCTAGTDIWHWAGNEDGAPDVVMACAGDVPTLETLAPVSLFRRNLSDLKVRVVNVVDLMTLQPANEHRTAWMTHSFDALFTTNKPVIFTCHGYPWLIHRLTYRRRNHDNIHVIKKKEQPQRRSIWPSESNRPSPACAECVRRVPRLNRSGIDRSNPPGHLAPPRAGSSRLEVRSLRRTCRDRA